MTTTALQDMPKAQPEFHAAPHQDVPTAMPEPKGGHAPEPTTAHTNLLQAATLQAATAQATATPATAATATVTISPSTVTPLTVTSVAPLTVTAVAALTTTQVAALSSTAAPALATAKPAKPGTRPVDQIHADIVSTQTQHAQLRAQAQTISSTVTSLKKQQSATADKLRGLRSELQSAAGAIAAAVESDIAEVEGFFQRLVKEL